MLPTSRQNRNRLILDAFPTSVKVKSKRRMNRTLSLAASAMLTTRLVLSRLLVRPRSARNMERPWQMKKYEHLFLLHHRRCPWKVATRRRFPARDRRRTILRRIVSRTTCHRTTTLRLGRFTTHRTRISISINSIIQVPMEVDLEDLRLCTMRTTLDSCNRLHHPVAATIPAAHLPRSCAARLHPLDPMPLPTDHHRLLLTVPPAATH